MNADEIKAIRLALWALEEQRKKFIFDANLFWRGIEITPHSQRAADVAGRVNKAMEIFGKWLNEPR